MNSFGPPVLRRLLVSDMTSRRIASPAVRVSRVTRATSDMVISDMLGLTKCFVWEPDASSTGSSMSNNLIVNLISSSQKQHEQHEKLGAHVEGTIQSIFGRDFLSARLGMSCYKALFSYQPSRVCVRVPLWMRGLTKFKAAAPRAKLQ